jgi:nucleotide-binding universal stress UspA family protein
LFVVDGSVPSREAATLAHGLLPKATEVLILQVVPQLPCAWNAWPAFPDAGEDLAKAAAYVAEVAQALQAQGWNTSTKVHFSLLSAAETDREVLKLVEALRPDLICLALPGGSVTANIVREASQPVLVAKLSATEANPSGHRQQRRPHVEPALAHRTLLLNPAGAFVFRQAGIL